MQDSQQFESPGVSGAIGPVFTPRHNAHVRFSAVRFSFTCDATVANRELIVRISKGPTVFAEVAAALDQAAGQVRTYTAAVGLPYQSSTQSSTRCLPLPDIWWPDGTELSLIATNGQAGDVWANGTRLLVEYQS